MRGVVTLVPSNVKSDTRGILAVMECGQHVPFAVKRAFVIAGMPPNTTRAKHAHRAQHQFLVCTAGAVTVVSNDGHERRTWRLDGPTHGLHAPPLSWLEVLDAAPGTSVLVLCDAPYDAADYIHDDAEFRRLTRGTV